MVIDDFPPDNAERRRYCEQAQAWLAAQAERLGISIAAVEVAIRRNGHLPAEIERMESAAELLQRRRG